MAIGNCRLIGIEGSHGTGKTTLALAVTAACKRQHIHAGCLVERARESPFIEAAVIYKAGEISIHAELHLLAAQIAHEQLMARHHELVVCDKTVANVLGYTKLLLADERSPLEQDLVRGMEALIKEYSRLYDIVFYCSHSYDLTLTRDPFRPVDGQFQKNADASILRACSDVGIRLQRIPTALSSEDSLSWIMERILTHCQS